MYSIRDTLGLFLLRYNLLEATEIVLENEAYLVEAAFGRIKLIGGAARTVIDEPFVLQAVKAFFQESDPLLLAASERAMLNSSNATVHGNVWGSMMPPVACGDHLEQTPERGLRSLFYAQLLGFVERMAGRKLLIFE